MKGTQRPRLVRCDSCEPREIELSTGEVATLRVEVLPRGSFGVDEVEEIKIFALRDPIAPDASSWVVVAALEEQAWARLAKIVEKFPFDSALVTFDEEALAVGTVAGWTSGVRIGRFGEPEAARRFADRFAVPVSLLEVDVEADEALRMSIRDLGWETQAEQDR